jgi:hypothetical protein
MNQVEVEPSLHVSPPTPQTIDGRWVHKVRRENVLLASVQRADSRADRFIARMYVDRAHPFFFEHGLDHVPSMMLIEGGRQLGIAVSQMFLGVPYETAFAPTDITARFSAYGELDHPIDIDCEAHDKVYRHEQLVRVRLDGRFIQGGRSFGEMSGVWIMMPPDIYRRLRNAAKANLCAALGGNAK